MLKTAVQAARSNPGKIAVVTVGVKGASQGLTAPAGTPKAIVDMMAGTIKKASQSKDFVDKMESRAVNVEFMGPEDYKAYWTEAEREITALGN